ncbi:hypothetical protein GCM10007086_27390 [Photobacterium aphoticum]|nr:hypothetical protein GCM10007086_27390 [Photobacterium aphoticum]
MGGVCFFGVGLFVCVKKSPDMPGFLGDGGGYGLDITAIEADIITVVVTPDGDFFAICVGEGIPL